MYDGDSSGICRPDVMLASRFIFVEDTIKECMQTSRPAALQENGFGEGTFLEGGQSGGLDV